ncbi:MAG: hypothetical protein QM770_07525 [Tepidisphaeraceae bacterium]
MAGKLGAGFVKSMALQGFKELANAIVPHSPIVEANPGSWLNQTQQEISTVREAPAGNAILQRTLARAESRDVHGNDPAKESKDRDAGPER